MTHMILWRAEDKPTLFESEEYESYAEAKTALAEFHEKYPWNTYLLVQIEVAEQGDEALRPKTHNWLPSEHL